MKILAHIAEASQAEYIIALLGLFGFIVFWRILNRPRVETEAVRDAVRTLAERFAGFMVPSNVSFHPGHAWARLEGVDTVTVGMDDFAAKLLGSADSISLPKLGTRVKQGSLGWRFKTDSRVIHMLSPVEGEVVAVNYAVANSPGAAFEDPYGQGWLFKVKSNNLTSNLKNMIPSGIVGEWLENIRQSIAGRGSAPALSPLYADGGEPVRGFARVVDPEGWDDLVREFFLTK
ncbi:MAG: glycine cleavage system protein H [Syntrophobacteraceae bacterium]|jgi:glycine cleavage system H lipoate-binding protein